ncbi:hypothetical protein A3D42_01870 [Candidatus Nomurabacteria bacterium RIFCSPHIGHO2_02_FULL_41_18]|uniref:Uncharacterized protein n=1 Tax=Candidatus Nomurabacteria bacterium RIFCSPHIGHO2_02_FULL_41_18 TaxID=1801754 RepID=A0A1F6W844_9BACT|nr:MAG: hypothetical protein A2737_01815 [Candidatus Nomurabacteria bacterium RIFCSPHIGHO2_01_FULL_41_71]OGI78004.1 MAG: hypothetical protein A3D42_01870 [Candidatus Nomurabacteria bacterium RIFCSPHIGHO2_02_FULL_41_18]OGI90283.1 MAG: hypothetical protein A3B01_03195 [Candidatus Nomurabacteria bacterium RIFCSPLOWO2_01_FULL_41_52b]OGJ00014.1 MAG: hypothetical protein A3I90_02345 [Candidatus Nomurabacteria bacterium RIFCSPLOWO2_02_FULL_41_9]
MTPKTSRADRRTIEKIFKTGKSFVSNGLIFKFFLDKSFLSPKISFIVPKTIAKGAVDRNRLRRQGYGALQIHFHQFPKNTAGAFVFKKLFYSVADIENEIKNILFKIN